MADEHIPPHISEDSRGLRAELSLRKVTLLSRLGQLLDHGQHFGTMRAGPWNAMKWEQEGVNAFVAANVLLPLTLMKDAQANAILNEGISRLMEFRDRSGLWRYFLDRQHPYSIPYETDTNAIVSHVMRLKGLVGVDHRHFLDQLMSDGHFNLWFLPNSKVMHTSPVRLAHLMYNRLRARKFDSHKRGVIDPQDREFCVTANVLSYLGDTEATGASVDQLMTQMHGKGPIPLIYYPSEVIACHLFARCRHYGGLHRLTGALVAVRERVKESLEAPQVPLMGPWAVLPAANALLMLDDRSILLDELCRKVWELYDEVNAPFAFYCSHSILDRDPESGVHNACFGSPAITISLYLEHLELLERRALD